MTTLSRGMLDSLFGRRVKIVVPENFINLESEVIPGQPLRETSVAATENWIERINGVVVLSSAAAVAAYLPLVQRIPALADCDASRWDRIGTIAVLQVAQMHLTRGKRGTEYGAFMVVLIARLHELGPDLFAILDDLSKWLEHARPMADSYAPDEKRRAFGDAVGAWMFGKLWGRTLNSRDDTDHASVIGHWAVEAGQGIAASAK